MESSFDFPALMERLRKIANTVDKDAVYCSACGAEMIKRKSKWGDGYWYGCSNYPKCKNTLK